MVLSRYLIDMTNIFFIAMLIAMFLTAISLAIGIGLMVKGGKDNVKYGNHLMRARVYFQGIALVLFALAFMSASGS